MPRAPTSAEDLVRLICEGHSADLARAARRLTDEPQSASEDPALACAIGATALVEAAIVSDPAWLHRPLPSRDITPLGIVTHSRLIGRPEFEDRLVETAALLLGRGADPNQRWTDRRWPVSPLSPLYGAAGVTHNPRMTALLLAAGADPNDGESLYHSVEAADPSCTIQLLEAHARVPGTNALGRVLDYDRLDRLNLLLRHGGDAGERPWIHHAILRGRSTAHVEALLQAGGDPRATNPEGLSLFLWATLHGRTDVTDILEGLGASEPLSPCDRFVALCAAGREEDARGLIATLPDVWSELDEIRRQALPRLAAIGAHAAVRAMAAVGWPLEVTFGWGATALNHAVFKGDTVMAAILLDAGADWRTPHGFGDNVIGTLSHASQADDIGDPAPGDYPGCARILLKHGVPLAEAHAKGYGFSETVVAALRG